MTDRSQTRPSTPLLSDRAKVAYPSGIVKTGWPEVERQHRKLGIRFAWFQEAISKLALAKREDGTYAATVGGVVLSIPRQVGKTFMLCGLTFALCLIFPGMTVLWTAQQLRTAKETLRAMQGFARRKAVKPFIAYVRVANGEGEVGFINGSRILFGARDYGFGLGMAGVDILVFDEGQRLSDTALDDMLPTQNRAANPLFFIVGTPPRPTDSGEVFTRKRAEALSGTADDMVYVEFSADPDLTPRERIDWDQVAKGNPSFPEHTPKSAILRMWKNLGAESFWREGYGIWDSDANSSNAVITKSAWSDCRAPDAEITSRPTVAIDVSPMLTHTGIVAAGKTADGRVGVEVTSDGETLIDYREGTEWAVELLTRNRAHVWMAAGSAAETLADRLVAGGCRVDVMSRTDYAKACVNFAAMVAQKRLVHRGQSELDKHVTVGAKRSADEGLWTWGRIKSSSDITLLVAATVAAGALHSTPEYDVLKTIL